MSIETCQRCHEAEALQAISSSELELLALCRAC
jgi:hypothetical protein